MEIKPTQNRRADLTQLIKLVNDWFNSDLLIQFEIINRKNKKERILCSMNSDAEYIHHDHDDLIFGHERVGGCHRWLDATDIWDNEKDNPYSDECGDWVERGTLNRYLVNQFSQTTTDYPEDDRKRIEYYDETFDSLVDDMGDMGKLTKDEVNDWLEDFRTSKSYSLRFVGDD